MHKECLSAIKPLQSNSNILINKPDKKSGVVILSKTDYITKRNFNLEDEAKFLLLGTASKNNKTSKIKYRIRRRLLQLHRDDLLPTNLNELIQRLTLSGRAYTACSKRKGKMYHSNPSCLCPVQRNTSGPKVYLLFSNQFSLSTRASAYGTPSPLLTSLKLQLWNLPLFSSVLLIFRVYFLMSI